MNSKSISLVPIFFIFYKSSDSTDFFFLYLLNFIRHLHKLFFAFCVHSNYPFETRKAFVVLWMLMRMKFKWAFAVLCERIYNNTKRRIYTCICIQIDGQGDRHLPIVQMNEARKKKEEGKKISLQIITNASTHTTQCEKSRQQHKCKWE